MLIVGDREDGRNPIEDRKTISINQNNFNSVMESAINLNIAVPNALDEKSESDLNVNLEIKSLQDFLLIILHAKFLS